MDLLLVQGECPEELEPSDPGQPVDVNLIKKDEDWSEPEKPKYTAFQGSGRTLAATPSSIASNSAAAASSAAAADGEWKGVDESKPTTSLQLRMADGSRMVSPKAFLLRVIQLQDRSGVKGCVLFMREGLFGVSSSAGRCISVRLSVGNY